MSIHYSLVAAIRRYHEKQPSAATTEITNMDDEEVIRMMFVNFRGGDSVKKGLQLSQGGIAIMAQYFRSYPISFPYQKTFNSKHILFFDRACMMPWYVRQGDTLNVILFESDLAMRAKLVGDLDILISAFN